jgi:chromosome segregation ATPase
MQAFVGLLTMSAVAAGGWLLWTQHEQQQRTLQHLQHTQAALQEKEEVLTTLQEEQQRLSEAYDTLKTRWTQSDQQVKTLSDTAILRAKEAEELTRARSSVEQQLQEHKASQAQLQQQLETLRRDVTAKAAESAVLNQRVKELDRRALSEAELQDLAGMLEEGQKRQAFLQERILELSNAYEVLVRQQQALPGPAATKHKKRQAKAAVPAPALVAQPAAPSAPATHQRKAADLQRQLGDIYVAAYQFDKAAEAFEQSLTLYDDPNVHAQLAFLYNRFLHNQDLANRHVALAIGVDSSTRALNPMAQQHGLPRRDERLVWEWLIQDDSPSARATRK